MNKKLHIIFSTISGVICIVLYCVFFYRFDFTYVNRLAFTGVGNIIIDDDDSSIRIFRTSGNHADSRIEYGKITDACYNLPVKICEDSGKIYLVNFYNRIGYVEDNYDIYLLDFESGKRNLVASYTYNEIQSAVGGDMYPGLIDFYPYNDTLYLNVCAFSYDGTENIFYRMIYDGGEWVETERRGINHSCKSVFDVDGGLLLLADSGEIVLLGDTESVLSEDYYSELYKLTDSLFVGKNLSQNAFYYIDAKSKTEAPCENIRRLINAGITDFAEIRGVYSDNGYPVVTCYNNGNSFICDVRSGNVVSSIGIHSPALLPLYCAMAAAAAFAAVWIVGAVIYALKTRGGIVIKFIAMAVPIMLVCNFSLYIIIGIYTEKADMKSLCASLEIIALQYDSMALASGIEDFGEDGGFVGAVEEMRDIILATEYMETAFQTAAPNCILAAVDFYGYSSQADTYICVVDGAGLKTIDNSLEPHLAAIFGEAVSCGESRICESYDGFGQSQTILIRPAFSGGGHVNGAYTFSASSPESDYEARVLMSRILVCGMMLSVIILTLFSAFSAISLLGLKSLREKSAQFLSGGYVPAGNDKLSPKRGHHNEISMISDRFDELVLYVNKNLSEIKNLNIVSRAYFSDTIFEILGRKDISQINFDESSSIRAYVLRALLPEKYCAFEELYRLLSGLSAKLCEYRAFAADIDNTGFTVVSLSPKLINILFFLRGFDEEIRIMFDRCYVEVGVVGAKDNYRFGISLEDPERSRIIAETLANTGAVIAAAENAVDFKEYGFSKICIGMVDGEYIYEIFEPHRNSLVKLVKDNMKKGVELYFEGSYTAAREQFIMILRADRGNTAARYYINLIDNYFWGKEREHEQICKDSGLCGGGNCCPPDNDFELENRY